MDGLRNSVPVSGRPCGRNFLSFLIAYNFLKKMRPHYRFHAAYLSCLFTTGGHVHVDLIGGKRRLSLDDAG